MAKGKQYPILIPFTPYTRYELLFLINLYTMKNAILSGLIIGVLSGVWLFLMRSLGYTTFSGEVAPVEYISVLIPLVGIFLGLKSYRDNELSGKMGFLEAIVQSFKILIVGGAFAIGACIFYVSYIEDGGNPRDFSGRLFGALLVGVLFSFAASLLLTTRSNKVD